MINIYIVDDDQPLVDSLHLLLDTIEGIKLVGSYHSLGYFFECFDPKNQKGVQEVLLLDIELKSINSINHIQKIKLVAPDLKILMHSGFIKNEYLIQSIREGCNGYLLKGSGSETLINAIRVVAKNGSFLDPKVSQNIMEFLGSNHSVKHSEELSFINSDWDLSLRETQVARGLIQGLTYQEIADQNNLSINTIRHYVRSLYKKLEVNNKVMLMKKLKRNNRILT